MRSIVIGSGIATIGFYAFAGCTSLTDVTIKEGCQRIPSSSFSGCTSLKQIYIPSSVTLGSEVFADSGVEVIQIGKSIMSSINTDTGFFMNAKNLKYIICYATTPPNLLAMTYGGSLYQGFRNYDSTTPYNGTNFDTNGTGRVYVPRSAINAYKTGGRWATMVSDPSFADYDGDANGRIYAIEDIGTISGHESDALLVTQ